MKKSLSIQLKAVFLLSVFSLNTLAGFGCSVGLDMGFNSLSKNEITEPAVHNHADGKKHHHSPQPLKAIAHVHADGKTHQHDNKKVIKHDDEKENSKNDKGCCNDDVLKFQSLDKNINANTPIDHPVLVAIVSIFLSIDIFQESTLSPLHSARYLFPPPPDILISNQRFQI